MTVLMKRRRMIITVLLMAAVLSMLALVRTDSAYAARDVEWGRFQNSRTTMA